MNANDKLAELINQAIDTYATMPLVNGCRPQLKYFLADYLLANGVVVVDMNVVSPKNRPLISQCLGRPIDEIIELVNAKDEGRILALPCMGDTVYYPVKGTGVIYETKVYGVGVDCYGDFAINPKEYPNDAIAMYGVEVGKTVFLSRELAEEALEAKQNDKE